MLKLTAAAAQDSDRTSDAPSESADGASGADGTQSGTVQVTAADADDSTARGLGVGGLVVGVLGLAAVSFAVVRTRSARS